MDIIDSKIYKEKEEKTLKKSPELLLEIYFDNKRIDLIRLNRILRQPSISIKMPQNTDNEDIVMIVHTLCQTIRFKIFNYTQTVQNLNVDEWTEGQKRCDSTSKFKDSHHNHIITEDLNIIENEKLKKLLQKGSKHRENKGLNWHKVKEYIQNGTDEFIQNQRAKNKVNTLEYD